MKNKRKITLALLAGLGLLTLGTPSAKAKSTNPNPVIQHQTNVTHQFSSSHSLTSLKLELNRLKNQLPKADQSPKQLTKSVKLSHHERNNSNSNNRVKTVKNHVDSHKKGSAEASNSSKRIKKAPAKALNYNHTVIPKKPQKDHNHGNISNMSHFVKMRKPFRYLSIGGNTRDLGGYLTANRKYRTRVDRIIRSADLDGLSKSGVQALQKLHVNQIVDLRYQTSKDGIQGHPDPNELHGKTLKGTGISYQKDPVYSYNEAHQFDHYMKNHDIHGEYYFYGAPSVTEPHAIRAYQTIFNDLLNNDHGAILFHCNLGRDRTGVTSALILSSLGVSRDTIFHDYLLTDRYHDNFHQKPYSKQAGELMYFFNTIDQNYGSVDNYLHQAVGLSHDDVQQLRSMYLVSSKAHQMTVKLSPNKLRRFYNNRHHVNRSRKDKGNVKNASNHKSAKNFKPVKNSAQKAIKKNGRMNNSKNH